MKEIWPNYKRERIDLKKLLKMGRDVYAIPFSYIASKKKIYSPRGELSISKLDDFSRFQEDLAQYVAMGIVTDELRLLGIDKMTIIEDEIKHGTDSEKWPIYLEKSKTIIPYNYKKKKFLLKLDDDLEITYNPHDKVFTVDGVGFNFRLTADGAEDFVYIYKRHGLNYYLTNYVLKGLKGASVTRFKTPSRGAPVAGFLVGSSASLKFITENMEVDSEVLFNDEGVTYYNIPYRTGLYKVTVPWDCDESILDTMNVDELPDCVKIKKLTSPKIMFPTKKVIVRTYSKKKTVIFQQGRVGFTWEKNKLYIVRDGDKKEELPYSVVEVLKTAKTPVDMEAFINLLNLI